MNWKLMASIIVAVVTSLAVVVALAAPGDGGPSGVQEETPSATETSPPATPAETPTATPDPTGDDPSASVDVCHIPLDNQDNAHTISISENALEDHLAHGDDEGACASSEPSGSPEGVGLSASVDVCHIPLDNQDNAHTISISESALEDHLAHGDDEGACASIEPSGSPEGVGLSASVDVCHIPLDNQDNAHTISISESALEDHLAHGDDEGPCP